MGKKPIATGQLVRSVDRSAPLMREPQTEKELAFCRAWLKHNDHVLAARDAGYRNVTNVGLKLKKRLLPYLSAQKKLVEAEYAREIVYDQRDLLNEMAGIGFANVLDYVVVVVEECAGKRVKTFKQKPVDELTRRQASAISDIQFVNGIITYKIPDPAEKYRYLYSLAKNLGLFTDKLIMAFRNENQRQSELDFRDTSDAEMEQLQSLLVQMLGDPARQVLGLPTNPEPEEAWSVVTPAR